MTQTMNVADQMTVGTQPLRTGRDFLKALRKSPRHIVVAGEKVTDPTSHPAFRDAARSIARLYDYAAAPENRETMTFPSPRDGGPVLRAFQIPHSHDDLRARRCAAEKWAELTFGLMGRSPDHVAGFFCGFAAKPEVFAAGGQAFADNVTAFYEYARDTHAYISYAIVPPQTDRSKAAHEQSDKALYAGVTRETADGIYISGAQQLATGAVFSDYIQLSNIPPLRPGEENQAVSLVVPTGAQGVKLYVRRPYSLSASDPVEYPLTTRFDETDAVVVFDDVFVPWEHVFAYKNLEVTFQQWWKTPAHLYGNLQAQARYATKLRFLAGLANRVNETTGNAANPAIQQAMGELVSYASIVDGMLKSQETMAEFDENGVLWPSRASLYSVMALQSQINPRVVDIARELSGASMLTVPGSVSDLTSELTASDIERYYGSSNGTAEDRTRLMYLAWDFIGSEFGNRHQQYEKFYGGAPHLVKMNAFRAFDLDRANALVDQALNLPPLVEA